MRIHELGPTLIEETLLLKSWGNLEREVPLYHCAFCTFWMNREVPLYPVHFAHFEWSSLIYVWPKGLAVQPPCGTVPPRRNPVCSGTSLSGPLWNSSKSGPRTWVGQGQGFIFLKTGKEGLQKSWSEQKGGFSSGWPFIIRNSTLLWCKSTIKTYLVWCNN